MSKIENFKNFVKKHKSEIGMFAGACVGIAVGCIILNKNNTIPQLSKASPNIDVDAQIDGMIEKGTLGLFGEVLKVEKNSSREVFGHGRGMYTLADLGKYGEDLVKQDTTKYSLEDKLTGVLVFFE